MQNLTSPAHNMMFNFGAVMFFLWGVLHVYAGLLIVAFVEVADFESFQKNYIEPAGVIMAKYGGKQNKEESFPPGFGIILKFPGMEKVEEFYADPDYASLIKLRREQGKSTLAFLPQGMDR